MSAPTTNQIATALLSLLASATFNLYAGNGLTFVTARRRFQMWSNMPTSNMPAVFLWEPDEEYNWKATALAKIDQTYNAIIYLSAPADETLDPVQDLDAVKDAVFNILKPSSSGAVPVQPGLAGQQTLGGLVDSCRVQGKVIKASGDIDGISLLIIPIRVLLGAPII